MPTYEITDPDTGKKLRLTGDAPPSEQEIQQVFSEYYGVKEVEPEKPQGGVLEGAGEALQSVGASV